MAFEPIFDSFRRRCVTLQYGDGAMAKTLLKIDCTRSEDLALESQAVLHGIEDGSRIADHVIRMGRTLTIEGMVSDTPIELTGSLTGTAAGIMGAMAGGAAGSLVTSGTVVMANLARAGSVKPSKAALDIFNDIYNNSTPLTIIDGLATYTNMIMEKFTAPRSAQTAGGLAFKASFRQVAMISGRMVDLLPATVKSEDVRDLSAAEQHQGRKQGDVLNGEKESKASSWLYRMIRGNN